MNRKIEHVIVGGSGFIAMHLREKLRNQRVLILDLKPPKMLKPNESFKILDIRDRIFINMPLIDHGTVIHHLAAVHFDFQTNFYETNVSGTKNVIKAFPYCQNWLFYSSVAT